MQLLIRTCWQQFNWIFISFSIELFIRIYLLLFCPFESVLLHFYHQWWHCCLYARRDCLHCICINADFTLAFLHCVNIIDRWINPPKRNRTKYILTSHHQELNQKTLMLYHSSMYVRQYQKLVYLIYVVVKEERENFKTNPIQSLHFICSSTIELVKTCTKISKQLNFFSKNFTVMSVVHSCVIVQDYGKWFPRNWLEL